MATAVADPTTGPDVTQWPYRFEIVPLKYLKIDTYQRPLTSFVDRIEKRFNPALVGCLCVSERSKTHFAVIDGQTRAEGMRRLGMKSAPCVVFHGLTREQEAELFALFQTERRGMTSSSRFNAQVVAKDKRAVAINEIITGLGFEVGTTPGALKAIAALEYVYQGAKTGIRGRKVADPELLAKVLETIRGAWPKLPDTARSAVTIRGLGFFFVDHEEKMAKTKNMQPIDLERLIDRLSKVSPSELAKRAESLKEGRGMTGSSPAYLAEAIQAQYRKAR